MANPGGSPPNIQLTPTFKWGLILTGIATFLSFLASVLLGLVDPSDGSAQAANIKTLIDTFTTTWKMGVGAIIGLIGGKAL